MEVPERESHVISVEASYRIRLPQPLCKRVGWISGDQPVEGYILVANSGRCRILSLAEVAEDSDLQLLLVRIAAVGETGPARLVEFPDEGLAALPQRLFKIQISPHETSGWRFTLPRLLAAIMRVRPKGSDLAALVVQQHVEIWTIDAVSSALSIDITEIL